MSNSASSTPGESLPVVLELDPQLSAVDAFRALAGREHLVYFDSAMPHEKLGRYSFVACDPLEWVEHTAASGDPLAMLQGRVNRFTAVKVEQLPPFQGGAAGVLGYELGRTLEAIPAAAYDEFAMPVMGFGLYDVVVAFDHQAQRGWIVSQGFPETDLPKRVARARERAEQMQQWLEAGTGQPNNSGGAILPPADLAPEYPTEVGEHVTSNFSREAYLRAVARGVEYIRAGDIFQVNLAQRLLSPAVSPSVELYHRLRMRNPAPFAGYLDLGDFQIASASPERFLKLERGCVETRPIKGTRPRSQWPEANLFAGDDLTTSRKDRAENVMIVDLMRNDLSRVCTPESVHVSQLCGLESYAFVQHLVSVVEGRLLPGKSAVDLLRAAFPGGSITGAPKVRAMEIIAQLEPTARGAYCGSLFYLGFDGTMDSSILIRTVTAGKGWWQLPVGGGIVAESDPRREYEETWHKAAGILRALAP